MIHLEKINKSYFTGKHELPVLQGLDLEIDGGEFVSVMGPSGSGKSTLLNILGILDTYDSGKYFFDGKLMEQMSETQSANFRNDNIDDILNFLFL